MARQTRLQLGPDLWFPADAVTQPLAMMGVRRSGKSNAAAVLAEAMFDHGLPWVAIDPKGDWWGLRSSADGTGPGLPIPIFGGLHGDMPLVPEAGTLMADLVFEHNLTCVLDVSRFSVAARSRFLVAFGDRLFELHQADPQPRCVFLEEAHRILPQQVRAEMAHCVGTWTKVIAEGGGFGLGICILDQRCATVNKDGLSVASWMRAPIWQGWRGRALRTMEELWDQSAGSRPVRQGDGFEFIDLPTDANTIKTLCFKNGMGWWAPIRRVIRHQYDGPMIRLMQKWGEVVVTPNHSVYGADGSLAKPQDNPELLAIRHINQQHTRDLEEITLAAPDSNFVIEDGWIRARDRAGRPARSRLKQTLKAGDLEAFCRFLGAFLSEGSVHCKTERGKGSSWIIQISNTNRPWLEGVAQDIRQFVAMPASVHIHRGSSPGLWSLNMSHMALGKWLAKHCGQHAEHKRFPDFVFNLAKPIAVILLNHLNDGDGQWLETGRWRYSTKSAELAQGVGFLCSLHAMGYTVSRDENTKVYRVLHCDWYNHRDAERRHMETIPYKGWVYDLEIDDRYTHNFTIGVGNVVVHNTQIEAMVALRTTSPQDRKAIHDWMVHHALAGEITESLPSLASGEAWVSSSYWLPEHGQPPIQRARFRQRRTFDSGATPVIGQRRKAATIADIDLGALEGRMAAVVEKAGQDDPKALRRRIADLERKLARADYIDPADFAELADDNATVHARLAEALARPPERVEVQAVSVEQYIALADLAEAMSKTVEGLKEALGRVRPWDPRPQAPAPVPLQSRRPAPVPASPRTPSEPQVSLGVGVQGSLPKAERSILTVLAQFPEGRTNVQVAMLAGYSHKGGGFRNSMSALRTAGRISRTGPIRITADGSEALGADWEPLPSGPALLDHWVAQLPKAEGLVLRVLVEAWPGSMTKDEVAAATGYSPGGGGFRNALSKLRTLSLIGGYEEILADETLAREVT